MLEINKARNRQKGFDEFKCTSPRTWLKEVKDTRGRDESD
jgi:hypothetical protein